TKLEELEDSTAEFKVPEVPAVPQPAIAAEEEKLRADTGPITTAQQKSLAEILKNVRKVKDAKAFVDRVDPVKLNLPTYFEIIQTPMDLKTIESKLKNSEYKSVADLASDFDLMIQNSHTFNGAQHPVSVAGSNLQAYFRKALSKVPARDAPQPAPPEKKPKRPSDAFALGPDGTPVIRRDSTLGDRPKREIHRPAKDLPYASAKPRRKKFQQELRFVDHVVAEMNKQKYQGVSWPFAAPVDPVALNIPSYFSVIKKPMDFGTITQKSKTNQYENAKEFRGDVDLMFENCFKFNPTGDNINTLGKQFQDVFKRLWSE
ncbi:Bromodomain-containing protein, partial [Viridothelium virens]